MQPLEAQKHLDAISGPIRWLSEFYIIFALFFLEGSLGDCDTGSIVA